MLCPRCGEKTKVTDSRETSTGIWRRRKCLGCELKFSTKELIWYDQEALKKNESKIKRKVELLQESLNNMKEILG